MEIYPSEVTTVEFFPEELPGLEDGSWAIRHLGTRSYPCDNFKELPKESIVLSLVKRRAT